MVSADLGDVQRLVLHGTPWRAARHLLINFGEGAPKHLLHSSLIQLSGACDPCPELQCSVGFTRRGLERAGVPRHVMARLALKAPAFWAGPALRASRHLGLSGTSAPERWNRAFDLTTLDLVISVHGVDEGSVGSKAQDIAASTRAHGMRIVELPAAAALDPPANKSKYDPNGRPVQWVHFGYRDGLSRIGIEGWTGQEVMDQLRPSSRHQPGEFVLGHVADSGGNPWVAGPGLRAWPEIVRSFFRNGSFGVLQQIVQDVDAFEKFVAKAAKRLRTPPNSDDATPAEVDEIKAKLCGRHPDGWPLAVPCRNDPLADFDYSVDPEGIGCPFGSHVRRMNPRLHRPHGAASGSTLDAQAEAGGAAHFRRARPLLRRGMPYGPAAWPPSASAGAPTERGLIGHFFCASIEDQFEHLLGEWADRVPLGSDDSGGTRDPLIGAHEPRDGPFHIPQPAGEPLRLRDLEPFVHTAGAAYLFYPSLSTLKRIADNDLSREVEDEK